MNKGFSKVKELLEQLEVKLSWTETAYNDDEEFRKEIDKDLKAVSKLLAKCDDILANWT